MDSRVVQRRNKKNRGEQKREEHREKGSAAQEQFDRVHQKRIYNKTTERRQEHEIE